MKTTILKQSLLLLSSATLLAACGGDGGDSPVDDFGSNPGESGAQALLYAYPDNGQGEVPTKAPIALRFTSNVAPGNVNQSVTLCCDDQGENLDFEVERVDGEPRGVLLTPTDGLAPGTQYTVEINDLRLSKGTAKDQTLTFTTRTLQEGPKSAVVQEVPAGEDEFQLSRTMPNGSELEPVMDFSAFRFQFTQPIDRATASYGDGNSVVLRDSEGAVVEAGLLVDGAYMTVDPTDDYLTPGETYTLTLGGLESTYGETFAGETIEFTPKDSSPRGEPGFLVQKITQSGTSRLTGKGINQVPVNGTLLGEDVNVTQAQSDFVIAELADVTQYTDVTPIRLPKGTLLEGTPIEMVKIGGEVDAGFGSGDVTMRVLSDATGYLVPNPYTQNHPDNLRIVHLFMDVGIATANPQANGGFTQNLLHIHLVGVAEVDPNGGVLNIDATSMVEPDVLGLEYGYGLLSFQLQSYKKQTEGLVADARAALQDMTPPELQSWTQGTNPITNQDKSEQSKAGDPIILNFSEVLDPESAAGNVTLYRNEVDITAEMNVHVDGAALLITPKPTVDTVNQNGTTIRSPKIFDYSDEGQSGTGVRKNRYRLQVNGGLSDIAGNEITPIDKSFELANRVSQQTIQNAYIGGLFVDQAEWNKIRGPHSPIILAAYPGFPCALKQEYLNDLDEGEVDESRDLANNKAGLCSGGFTGVPEDASDRDHVDTGVVVNRDDILPVMTIPNNRPIIVSFNKSIDPTSVVLGDTFIVERIDGPDPVPVRGALEVRPLSITFTPANPWQEDDALYRYTLKSSGYTVCRYQTSGSYNPDSGYERITISPDCSDIGNNYSLVADHLDYTCGEDTICDTDSLPLQTNPYGISHVAPFNEDGSPTGNYVDYRKIQGGPATQAGGPDFSQFFRAETQSSDVLQLLTTQPVSDTNKNLFSERTNTGTSLLPALSSGIGDFSVEESGPGDVLGPNDLGYNPDYESYDPGALSPAPNSVKVLSYNDVQDLEDRITVTSGGTIKGMQTGCNWLGTPPEMPMECPEHKFSYLMSSLIAEVTDQVTDEGIKVNIWPGLVAGTSIDIYTGAATGGFPGVTGPQYLRMRYDGEDRSSPVSGHITTEDGNPVLRVKMDLYLDVPFASSWAIHEDLGPINMRSYPISMELQGQVQFLDDGRMAVEQWNTNSVDISILLGGGGRAGYGALFIPEYGSRLNFISEPIK